MPDVAGRTSWDLIDGYVPLLERCNQILLEFLLLHLVGCALEIADIDVLDVVLVDNGTGRIPVRRTVQRSEILLARALRGIGTSPLVFVTGPAENRGVTGVLGD